MPGTENDPGQPQKDSNHHETLKAFLTEEYKRYADLMKFSEETGEKRINFYLSLVTAIVGAIVVLYAKPPQIGIQERQLINLFVLLSINGLLVVGWMVYRRLVKRNENTDNAIANIDHIRKMFNRIEKWQPDEIRKYKIEKGFGYSDAQRKLTFRSLKDIVALINVFLLLFLIIIFTYTWSNGFYSKNKTDYWLQLSVSLSICIVPVGLHIYTLSRDYICQYWIYRLKARLEKTPTHGGSVVFRSFDGVTKYLMITAKNEADREPEDDEKDWVLPKGHVEKGESVRAAAIRELEEETGIKAEPVKKLGTARPFRYKKEWIVIAYYLFDAQQQDAKPKEGREYCWLTEYDFIESIKYPETKQVIKKMLGF